MAASDFWNAFKSGASNLATAYDNKVKEKQISKEIAELNELKSGLQAKWEAEKSHVDAIQQAKQEIENLKTDAEQAERNGDFGTVAEIRYGKLKQLEEQIEQTMAVITERAEERIKCLPANALKEVEVADDDRLPTHEAIEVRVERLKRERENMGPGAFQKSLWRHEGISKAPCVGATARLGGDDK